MKAYRWLLDLHLAVAAFCAPFLLLYAVSAVQMAYPRLTFPEKIERQFETTLAPGTSDPVAVHEALRASHDVRGELKESRSEAGVLHLRVVRPGRRYAIEVEAQSGRVRVREDVSTPAHLLNRLHHASGLSNREPVANAWGAAVVLVSAGLVALVTSGLWMWLERPKERRVGLLVLGASVTFALGLLVAIRLA